VKPGASFVATLLLLAALRAPAQPVREATVVSPDGNVSFLVPRPAPRLTFHVTFRGNPVVESSPLHFTVEGIDLSGDVVPAAVVDRYDVNETYAWHGTHSLATNRCNGARFPLRHDPTGANFTLEVRAFDDGAAFRLIVPDWGKPRVPDEATTFLLPRDSTVWYHDLGGHYEATYRKKPVEEMEAGEWAAPPVTFKLPGGAGYASITEAALLNYSGMALQADGKGGLTIGLGHKHPLNHPYELRYGKAEHERLSRPASVAGEIVTPWRVVLVGADLNALVNSDVLHNLCPPPDPRLFPKGPETDWVRPGRAVWKYLDGGQNSLEEMKNFSRWAGELGFEHHVIEGFWRRWSEDELRGLCDDAKQRNVTTWLWRHTRELRTPEARKEFFDRCQKAGAAGVKLDFFDHEAKEVVDLYETLLREAAERKLLVNFHGANKPTGLSRTWPNELTREAVRGMESSRLKERARHDATLPFTRLLAGHADYTPVHFGERRGDTTFAHQVASAAVLQSALLTYGAHPQKLLASPAVEMIRSIPATWDETIVLPESEIGELAAFARCKGETWFIAVLNGPSKRSLTVTPSFLGEGEYDALLVGDADGKPDELRVNQEVMTRQRQIAVGLNPGGGHVIRFTPRP
jgi:alpha-glucosidase